MQYILHVALVVMIAKGNISNVLNLVCGVITGLHHNGLLRFPQIREPLLMACHVIGDS